MVDTVRTLSALQTLLADNTAGDISAQDLRDFLVSVMLETATATVTTGNVTAAAGKHYELTVSGMTADRQFILPGTAVVGSEIRVKLVTDAPTDYELILIGDTGVSINGGTAATEWSRLFIDNECVTFRATGASNWDVVNDGRIPSKARAKRTTAQALTNSAWTVIEINSIDYQIGLPTTTSTPWTFTVKRAGKYQLNMQTSKSGSSGTMIVGVLINAATDANANPVNYWPSTSFGTLSHAMSLELSAGDTVKLGTYVGATGNNTRDSGGYTYPYLSIHEVL